MQYGDGYNKTQCLLIDTIRNCKSFVGFCKCKFGFKFSSTEIVKVKNAIRLVNAVI